MPAERNPRDLLPGTAGPAATKPVPRVNATREVQRARRRAAIRDVIDSLLLLAVDFLFFYWPGTHVPFLSRGWSVTILVIANLLLISFWIVTRYRPRFKARRIASTWNVDEQTRFKS